MVKLKFFNVIGYILGAAVMALLIIYLVNAYFHI